MKIEFGIEIFQMGFIAILVSSNRPKEGTELGTLCKLMKVWYWPTNCTIFVCLTVRIRPVYEKWGRKIFKFSAISEEVPKW